MKQMALGKVKKSLILLKMTRMVQGKAEKIGINKNESNGGRKSEKISAIIKNGTMRLEKRKNR
jgi:hypothetical protein